MRRSRAVLAVAAVAVVLPLSGCGAYGAHLTAGLHQQVAEAAFAPTATRAEHLAARAACARLPGVRAEPLVRSTKLSERLNDVRFSLTNASDRQVAALDACLSRQPGVLGVTVTDAGGM